MFPCVARGAFGPRAETMKPAVVAVAPETGGAPGRLRRRETGAKNRAERSALDRPVKGMAKCLTCRWMEETGRLHLL